MLHLVVAVVVVACTESRILLPPVEGGCGGQQTCVLVERCPGLGGLAKQRVLLELRSAGVAGG